MPVGEALALAERHRSAGRLDEADALCRKILAAAPNEPKDLTRNNRFMAAAGLV